MLKKIKLFNFIILFSFSIIIVRLFFLQIIERNYYSEKLSSKNNKIVYEDTSLRGRIYDRNNKLLVDNKLILNIIYKRKDYMSVTDEIKLAYRIAPKLDLNYEKLSNSYLKDFFILENDDLIEERISTEIKEKFKRRKINNSDYYKIKKSLVTIDDLNNYTKVDKKAIYLYYLMNNGYSYMEKIIKEDCSMEEFMFFSENAHNLDGFDTKFTYGREYLYGDTLKNILGSVRSIPIENKDYYLSRGYNINDKVGVSNIEFIYDDYLKGEKAMYLINNDGKFLLKDAKRGKDLYLTIDIDLQQMVDDILSLEVINAKNAYNTNYYNHSYVLISDSYGEILSMNGKEYLDGNIIDIAIGNITDTITPGSVVKGASMMVGYDTGAIKMGEIIKDECIKIKSTKEKCSVYTMGYINDIEALAYSSNVYQFKTAIRVGKGNYQYNSALKIDESAFDTYRDYFSRFGLGVNTGIELPNESRGYKGSKRDPGLLMNFAIGQYDTYTNIQLNQYFSTIARNGSRYKMHLLKEIKDHDKEVLKIYPIILNELNIQDEYIKRVQKGLIAVTTYGSGKNYVTIPSAGKTGTSESFYDSNNDGIIDTSTISTNFLMYYPTDNPQIVVSINSPNIATTMSNYKYPINQNISRYITNNIYKYIK